jgi:hypothetical protein
MAASSARKSPTPIAPERVEHELDLLQSAIALVADGGASRVVVVRSDGEPIIPRGHFNPGHRAVILREAPRPDGTTDIVVEPAG